MNKECTMRDMGTVGETAVGIVVPSLAGHCIDSSGGYWVFWDFWAFFLSFSLASANILSGPGVLVGLLYRLLV